MADAFISYSRKNGDFAHRLHTALLGQGRDIWMDWKDIPHTADWWNEISGGIEIADNFVLLISPDSISSPICNLEIGYARENNKRIVPIEFEKVDEATSFVTLVTRDLTDFQRLLIGNRDILAIARDNWETMERLDRFPFSESDDFDTKLGELLKVLDLDLEYLHENTRLLGRAKDWDRRGRVSSLLLRDEDLTQAENWLTASAAHMPPPTDQHRAYIEASRAEQDRQAQRAALQAQRTQQFRNAAIIAGVTLALALIGIVVLLVVTAQSEQRAGAAATAVSYAQASLSPVPQTLTPAAVTLAAANGEVAAANATLTRIPGTLAAANFTRSAAEAQADAANTQAAVSFATATAVNADILYMTGFSLFMSEQYPAAEGWFRQAIDAHPSPPAVYYYSLGRSCQQQGNYDCAEENFESSLIVDPNFTLSLINLAMVLREHDQLDDAEDALQGARAAYARNGADDPLGSAGAYRFAIVEGSLLVAREEWQDAIDVLMPYTTDDYSAREEVFYYLAVSNAELNRSDEACRFLTLYEDESPFPTSFLYADRQRKAAALQRELTCQ